MLVLCFKGELLHGCFCVLVFVFLEMFDRDCFKGIADMVLWILGFLCVCERERVEMGFIGLQMKERLKKKRNKILQAKAGSAKPMKVTFNK